VEPPNEQGGGAWRISGNAIQPRFSTAEIACLRLPVAFATQTGADPHRQAEIAEPDHETTVCVVSDQ